MNEEDYEFDSAGSSRLSSLFKRGNEADDSSLIYKAPKPPIKVSGASSKTFHKYIKLSQMCKKQLLGKYIIAITSSIQNASEILVYQTKNNIFIRYPVKENCLYSHTEKNSLIMTSKHNKFKIEFENYQDLSEFKEEYMKYGGIIELFHEMISDQSEDQSQLTLKVDSIGASTSDISYSDGHEKSKIVTRIEKIGLPLPFPISKQDSNAFPQDCGNILPHFLNNRINGRNTNDIDSTERNEIKDFNEDIKSDSTKLTIPSKQNENFTSVLMRCETSNQQLREAVMLLTSKLEEIIPSKQFSDTSHTKKLESKIKSIELKTENLQSELNDCYEKLRNLNCNNQISSEKQAKCLSDNSCQTSDSECNYSNETYSTIIIKILTFMKTLQIKKNKIVELKKIKDEIPDASLRLKLELYFNSIDENGFEENQINEETSENEFVADLKRVMNNMYHNICTACPDSDTKNLLAKQIKQACIDILNSYRNTC